VEKEAIKAHVIDVRMAQVSSYKSCNWILLIGHPRDRAPITWQIGARRTNHDREFCYGIISVTLKELDTINVENWDNTGVIRSSISDLTFKLEFYPMYAKC